MNLELPGDFSKGDSPDEDDDNAKETIELWLDMVIDDNGVIPESSSISSDFQEAHEFKGWVWAVVTVDISELPSKAQLADRRLPYLKTTCVSSSHIWPLGVRHCRSPSTKS